MPKKCVLCKGAHKTLDHYCEIKKKELEGIRKSKEATPAQYKTRLITASPQAPSPSGRSRLSAFQGVPNIPSLPAPRINKGPIESRSQAPTKRPNTTRETSSDAAGDFSVYRFLLVEISSSQRAQERQNGKVQVFERGELRLDPESS